MSKKITPARRERFANRMQRWMAKKLANIRANNPTRTKWLLDDIPPEPTPKETAYRERQQRRAAARATSSDGNHAK